MIRGEGVQVTTVDIVDILAPSPNFCPTPEVVPFAFARSFSPGARRCREDDGIALDSTSLKLTLNPGDA